MGIVESASTAPGVDQTNQHTEFYNNPMTEGEAGRLNTMINPTTYASSPGPINAFILGPGRPPIPSKVVSLILADKFVEMSDLLPENLGAQ